MPAPIIHEAPTGLAQGIIGAGSALGQALGQRMQQNQQQAQQQQLQQQQQAQQQQYGSILQQTLGTLPQDASPLQVTQALTQAVNQGVPTDIAQNYGTLYATLQKSQAGMPPGPEQINTMSTLFGKFGMDEDMAQRNAELWGQLTTGGQTQMAKMLVDQISRQQFSPAQGAQQETIVTEEEGEYKFPKVDIFEDRTPKERVKLKSELLKSNNADYKDLTEKIRKTDTKIMRYDQLGRLNETGKLPTGLERLNINWTTGDIRVPALANEETQLFVKTVNDFTTLAKDSYGARVTNFELGAFMKRLPTLANTEEGRRVIISQMKALTGLDRLYEESLKKVYDNYGMQKIDYQNAERIAADLRKDDEEKLKSDFSNAINTQRNYELRQGAPADHLPVKKPDGSIGYLPMDKVDLAKKKGWEIL